MMYLRYISQPHKNTFFTSVHTMFHTSVFDSLPLYNDPHEKNYRDIEQLFPVIMIS